MAPKKPAKVTSSSTKAARVKGGSNPVVTQGAARNRTARTTLGPAPKQRPMATGGTKGPLQGGTRSPSLKANPAKLEAGPAKVGPNLRQQSTSSSAGPRSVRPPSMNSLEAKPARVGPNLGQQSTSSSAGPRSVRPAATKSSGMTMSGDRAGKPTGKIAGQTPKPAASAATTPRTRTTMSYGPSANQIKPKGASQSSPLNTVRNAATRVTNTVKNAASQVSKSGVGKNLTLLANNPAAKFLGRAAVVGGIVSGLNDNLNPNSAMNRRDAELLRRIGNKLQGKPAKPAASTSRFAGARDKAIAKAKGIKGSPVLGPKKVGTGKVGTITQAFDRSFAAARKAGKATFMFQGKKYTTELK